MATLIGKFTPGSPEWHAARAKGLGGSEIAAVLGLSPWESRFSLWHRKMGLFVDDEVNGAMEWGTRLEDAVLAKYRDAHCGLDHMRVAGRGRTFAHPERPWQIANPDLLLISSDHLPAEAHGDFLVPGPDDHYRIVEAKCSRYGDDFGEPGTEAVPIYYRTQGLWYGDVFDLPAGAPIDFAVLIGGNDYREYTIAFDPDEAKMLRDTGREFLDTMERGEAPDIDAHSQTYVVLRELHPEIDGTEVEIADELALAYVAAKGDLEAAKANEQLARNLIAARMGNAKTATWSGHKIINRKARNGGTPWAEAGRKLPEITTS